MFEQTSAQKSLLAFVAALACPVAIYTGLFLQSWTAFLVIGVILPWGVHIAIEYFTQLKLVGLKGELRARGT